MKKVGIALSIVAIIFLVFSMTLVSASPNSDVSAKTTPGVQQTINAEKWATAHPDLVKGGDSEGNSSQNGKMVNRRGEIVSVMGNSIVVNQKDDILLTVTINVDSIVKIPGKKTTTSDLASGLLPGMKVTIRGTFVTDGSLVAQRISVIPGKPSKSSHVGTVTEITQDVSITIITNKGETFTYGLDVETKYLPEERKSELQVGSLVTVIFSRDVTGQPITAFGIVIHPADAELLEE
jgi:hypothetical protein